MRHLQTPDICPKADMGRAALGFNQISIASGLEWEVLHAGRFFESP